MVTWGEILIKVFGRSKKFLSIDDIYQELSETPYALGKMNKKIIQNVLEENCSDSSSWRGQKDYFKFIKIDGKIFWGKRQFKDYEESDLPHFIERNSKYKEASIKRYFHKIRERNRFIVQEKIESVLNNSGKLNCQVCNFNFEEFYGAQGKLFIECHHITPLSKLKPSTVTKLEDLAIVCSNCHRMLHRKPYPSLTQLRSKLFKK